MIAFELSGTSTPKTRLNVEADVWNAVLRLVDEPQTVQDMITAFGLDSVAAAKWTWKLTNGQQVECRTAPLTDDGSSRENRIWSFREINEGGPREDQVLHAQRLEAVGTVACQLTHEIKNALAPIIGAVELAQLTLPEDHRARSHLSQITRATERAGALAQKILCFGKNCIEPRQQHDLGTIVRESARSAVGRSASQCRDPDPYRAGPADPGRRARGPADPDEPVHQRVAGDRARPGHHHDQRERGSRGAERRDRLP